MTTILNAVSGTGLTQTADGSGIIKVQSNGVTTNALAWVNFNGTSASPITPRANYNVSSVTKNATGDYTLNFTSALTDANYAISVNGYQDTTGSNFIGMAHGGTYTTSAVRIRTVNGVFSLTDMQSISGIVFGN